MRNAEVRFKQRTIHGTFFTFDLNFEFFFRNELGRRPVHCSISFMGGRYVHSACPPFGLKVSFEV